MIIMNLFKKKKKSDKNLNSTMILHQQQQEGAVTTNRSVVIEAPTITTAVTIKKPVPSLSATTLTTTEKLPIVNTARSFTPPTLVMPKPRRLLTPTRAILGRFDHDKTQVETESEEEEEEILASEEEYNEPSSRAVLIEDNEVQEQDIISPILLPTTSLHNINQTKKNNEDMFFNISKKKKPMPPTPLPNINNNKAVLQRIKQERQTVSSSVNSDNSGRVYESAVESLPDNDQGDKEEDSLPSISLVSKDVNTIPPQLQQQLNYLYQVQQEQQQKQDPSSNNSPTSSDRTLTATKQQQLQQQDDEKDLQLLEHLKIQIERLEQLRISDREEWSRKEQELLNHRQQMMETLMQTKDQLTQVLKTKEEVYQKQLQQQQYQQLKELFQALGEQEEEEEFEEVEQYEEEDGGYYYTNPYAAQEPPPMTQRKGLAKCRSAEYLNRRNPHSRSSSRLSNPYQYQAPCEEKEELLPKRNLPRRNSNASGIKSPFTNRFDPSPSSTMVPTPLQAQPMKKRQQRRRPPVFKNGKPIVPPDETYYHDVDQIYYYGNDPYYYNPPVTTTPRRGTSVKSNRSRSGSVGSNKRPNSRGSFYYQDQVEDKEEDEVYPYDNYEYPEEDFEGGDERYYHHYGNKRGRGGYYPTANNMIPSPFATNYPPPPQQQYHQPQQYHQYTINNRYHTSQHPYPAPTNFR